MTAGLLVHGISLLATPAAQGPVHGRAMRNLRVIPNAAIAISNGLIDWCGPLHQWRGEANESFDCGRLAVVPALIDPHTHAVWAGNRLANFEARASGISYEEILTAGGGIRSTIRATAACSINQLVELAKPRLQALIRSGAGTIEVKSGYGFEMEAEIRMLQAVQSLTEHVPARLIPTLLIHLPPADLANREAYLADVRGWLIPEVARRGLAKAVDVFVEQEAWTADEAETLIDVAREHRLGAKLHTEQFHRVGGLEMGVRKCVLSVDHLEACVPEQLQLISHSMTIATVLPGVSLHLGIPAAPGRALIDAGAAVAVGTDLNPGSSPLFSMAEALGLAVRLNELTPSEALTAGTVNAAAASGLVDCGRLEAGMRADFLVLAGSDWRDLVYVLGANPVRETWISGRRAEV